MQSSDYSYIDEILSETDDSRREAIITQLKNHLIELENNNKFVEDLSNKFSSLQQEFHHLSYSKKQIESELNKKIDQLQNENEKIASKYQSAKDQIKSLISSHSEEINHLRQINEMTLKDNANLLKENKRLIKQLSAVKEMDDHIVFYQKQLEEANNSIMKLNGIIKNLEGKNESFISKMKKTHDNSGNKEVVKGLKKVLEEKENMITNLYNSYDKLSLNYADTVKKNEKLRNEILSLKNKLTVYQERIKSKNENDMRNYNINVPVPTQLCNTDINNQY